MVFWCASAAAAVLRDPAAVAGHAGHAAMGKKRQELGKLGLVEAT